MAGEGDGIGWRRKWIGRRLNKGGEGFWRRKGKDSGEGRGRILEKGGERRRRIEEGGEEAGGGRWK